VLCPGVSGPSGHGVTDTFQRADRLKEPRAFVEKLTNPTTGKSGDDMGRRKRRKTLFEDLMETTAALPWWVGFALAVATYLLLHPIATGPAAVSVQGHGLTAAIPGQFFKILATIGQYLLPAAFGLGSVASLLGRAKRRRLHAHVADDASGQSLSDMSWQDFELLVGEAYRRQGYQVREWGGAAPDGGVDLELLKDGARYLVQCKHWKDRKVGVSIVRELYGVLVADGAAGAFVVISGVFTNEAKAFARGKNIELVDGTSLTRLVAAGPEASQSQPSPDVPLHGPSWANGRPRTQAGGFVAAVLVVFGFLWLASTDFQNSPADKRQPAPVTAKPTRALRPPAAAVRTQPRPAPDRWARQQALEQAFEAQYKPPKGCDNWKSEAAMVACGNDYINARRAFMADAVGGGQ